MCQLSVIENKLFLYVENLENNSVIHNLFLYDISY